MHVKEQVKHLGYMALPGKKAEGRRSGGGRARFSSFPAKEEARTATQQHPAATSVCWDESSSGCWHRVVRGLGDRLKQEQGLGKLRQRRLWKARSYGISLTHGVSLGSGKGWQAARWPVAGISLTGFGRRHRQLPSTSCPTAPRQQQAGGQAASQV